MRARRRRRRWTAFASPSARPGDARGPATRGTGASALHRGGPHPSRCPPKRMASARVAHETARGPPRRDSKPTRASAAARGVLHGFTTAPDIGRRRRRGVEGRRSRGETEALRAAVRAAAEGSRTGSLRRCPTLLPADPRRGAVALHSHTGAPRGGPFPIPLWIAFRHFQLNLRAG